MTTKKNMYVYTSQGSYPIHDRDSNSGMIRKQRPTVQQIQRRATAGFGLQKLHKNHTQEKTKNLYLVTLHLHFIIDYLK